MCHSRAWIVRVLQPGDSSRQAAFCCLGPYIKGWGWAAENPVYKSKTVYSQKPVAAQGLSAFLSYIMDRNDQAKAGVTGAPGAKKRTPPFRVEFFSCPRTPRTRKRRAAIAAGFSLALRIIAQVFENVKPSRRNWQRKCSTPAQPPKGRVDHCATMRRRGRRQQRTQGGPPKAGGVAPACSLALSRSPQRGRRERGGRRGEPHANRRSSDGAAASGRSTRAAKPRGQGRKKGG